MKKLKFPMAIVAMLVAVTLAFAFRMPAKENNTEVRYHYTSPSPLLSEMQDIDNWVAEDPACSSSGTKPCAIDFEGDLEQFEEHLQEFSSPEAVTAAAIEKKN